MASGQIWAPPPDQPLGHSPIALLVKLAKGLWLEGGHSLASAFLRVELIYFSKNPFRGQKDLRSFLSWIKTMIWGSLFAKAKANAWKWHKFEELYLWLFTLLSIWFKQATWQVPIHKYG